MVFGFEYHADDLNNGKWSLQKLLSKQRKRISRYSHTLNETLKEKYTMFELVFCVLLLLLEILLVFSFFHFLHLFSYPTAVIQKAMNYSRGVAMKLLHINAHYIRCAKFCVFAHNSWHTRIGAIRIKWEISFFRCWNTHTTLMYHANILAVCLKSTNMKWRCNGK